MECNGNLAVRERLHMLCHVCLSAERLAEHISGWVIRAESVRYRPFHH